MESPVIHRLVRASSADTIERDLREVWRDAARGGPVQRALLSNLIVIDNPSEPVDADTLAFSVDSAVPLADVASRHPCRTIVLHHTRGSAQPAGPLSAEV